MAVSLSTYAETQKPVEATEAVTPTTETPATENTAAPDPAATPTQTAEPITVTEKDESTSEFNISIEGAGTEEPQTPSSAATQPVYNWKEEIKKVPKGELVKELGLTDFALEINDYLSKGGKASDYLAAKAIDYNQITDESLIKDDLKKQYPTFSHQQIDLLFNRKYALSEDALDEDKEFIALQLKADAYKVRQSKIEEQQKFKIPDTPILQTDAAYEQWKSEQESRPKLIDEARNFYASHEATKTLNESKRVTISLGDGVPPFNFIVDKPELITQTLTDDGSNWRAMTSTKTGEPDVPKQQLITLFGANPNKFCQDIFNYGVSQGMKKLVGEGQNAQRPQAPVHAMTGEKPTYKVGTFGGGR